MKAGGSSAWNYGLVRKTVEAGGLLSFIRRFWNHVEACELIEEPHMVLVCKHLEAAAISGTRSLKPDLSRMAWAQPVDMCEWVMDPTDPTGLTKNLTPGCPKMIQDLVIAIPPGMSKSKIVSVFFHAWVWTWCPGAKFITTSYADDLAIDFGRQSFDLMRTEDFRACWPELEIEDGERAAMSDYRNTAGGRRWSMPMGGKVTGKHGHFLMSDDPVKPDDLKLGGDSAREQLNQVKYRWDNLFSNRSAHAATFTRIVIAQRLHHEDLSGHYVRQGAVHLKLPMLFEPHDVYESVWGYDWREEKDELLAPLRFPQEVIDTRLKITSGRDWAAQYQQRPSPEDGSNFKAEWFKNLYEGHPWGNAKLVLSVDASNKKEGKDRQKADYTVITVWARVGTEAYLVDMVRARMGFKDQLLAIAAMRRKWANVGNILIEDKANGPAIIDVLKSKFPGVIALDPQGGKEARAAATEWVWAAGNIWLPKNAPWLQDFIDEHLLFPVGSNDDMVDSTSQFVNWSFSRDRKALFKKAMAVARQRMLTSTRHL